MWFKQSYLPLFFCLLISSSCLSFSNIKQVSVKQYGAKGNGVADDSRAIINAIKAGDVIVFPAGVYNIKGPLKLSHVKNKAIIATGATIKNLTPNGTFVFDKGTNIAITGGKWIHRTQPAMEGPTGNEHTFMFIGTSNIKVEKVSINGSAQMGICMMGVIGATISNNLIVNCFRDGIYSHYSAKLTIDHNTLENIKDDAISMHDYGLIAQKPELARTTFKQAGQSTVSYNTVSKAFQGFSSIGCQNVVVQYNKFTNTVNAGINIFNSVLLFKGSTARANNIVIKNNTLNYNGGTQKIMGKERKNGGQLGGGRAAIMVTAFDEQDLINNPKTRLRNITVKNNVITNCYINGAYLAEIDGLTFLNNTFTNCDIDRSPFLGRVVEISNSTNVNIDKNNIIDNRNPVKHDAGFQVKKVTGTMKGWTVKGYGDKVSGYVYDSAIN